MAVAVVPWTGALNALSARALVWPWVLVAADP